MTDKTVATTGAKAPPADREITRAQERYMQPPVDIYEGPEGLVLLADLPGMAPSDLKVHLEDDILTIEATANHAVIGEPIYREFELVNFFRQFELSEQEKITAALNQEVLTLH
jgi:HSP20 family protein